MNVRPVGEIEGDSPGAIIARIENRLKAGDLPGCLAQATSSPAAAAELLPWIEQVKTRIADNELDALEARNTCRDQGLKPGRLRANCPF